MQYRSGDDPILAYKGFNKDMTCRGFQYKEGGSYHTVNKPIRCEQGFHACTEPIDVFSYYNPCLSVYHQVGLFGDVDTPDVEENDDSKICSSDIVIEKELDPRQLVDIQIEKMKEDGRKNTRAFSDNAHVPAFNSKLAVSDGTCATAVSYGGTAVARRRLSVATTSGLNGRSITSDLQSTAVNNWGRSITLGGRSIAVTHCGVSTAKSYSSIAASILGSSLVAGEMSLAAAIDGSAMVATPNSVAVTINGHAKGVIGSYLIFIVVNETQFEVHPVYVDGEKIKELICYQWDIGVGKLFDNDNNTWVEEYYERKEG